MNREVIYVVGHRNPDTDSVCSAMAYARLRQRQGLANVFPARAGNLNKQTEFVLEELGLPQPRLLNDVHPRVRDVISDQVVTIPCDAPLSRAMELFNLHHIRQLPVLDAERRPRGLLVLKRVTERFLVPGRESEIRRVQASPASIQACLRARCLAGFELEEVEELQLYVGAMAARTFQGKLQDQEPRRMILLTGDRPAIQRQAVEAGVRVLVVTGDLPIDPEILALAGERRVTVLVTPFDTATSAWLTRLATPVGSLVAEDCLKVQLQDRVDELRLKLLHSQDPGAVVLDEEGRVAGIATKSNLLEPSPVKLVLVDHNELSQAVPGADKVAVIEVIDHHRLGNFHTDQPIRFINQPLGSTCSVVTTLYRQAGLEPEPPYAALLLAGLLSDTVILKSPTTTELDRELAAWLGELSGFAPEEFGPRLFQAGSSLGDYPDKRALILSDFKEFGSGDQVFGIGQVEVISFHEFLTMKEEVSAALEKLRQEKQLATIGLLVTDIVQGTSLLLALGSRELPYLIGFPQIEEHLYELKGILSRKKQLVPHLLKVLKG